MGAAVPRMSTARCRRRVIVGMRELAASSPWPQPERGLGGLIGGAAESGMTEFLTMNTSEISVERGSGNVFADLGLPDADTHLLKAELVSRIDDIIRQRRTTEAEAARALGLSRPELSRLLCGEFRMYSLERLFHFLMALGCDIDIVIRPSRLGTGGTLRVAAPELD